MPNIKPVSDLRNYPQVLAEVETVPILEEFDVFMESEMEVEQAMTETEVSES